jgi:hypothetical protein
MTYYIILEGESMDVCKYDAGILGETTKAMFYPNRGFTRLSRIINDYPEMVEKITILSDQNKKMTITQFLDVLKKYKIASL